ncbi:MAG TPA: glyoxylate/hydroxypyruvate reductase A [Methylibium sp.]|nr:glyoxylate/hydroxypyruvate reductase A [Methylibium sp.]
MDVLLWGRFGAGERETWHAALARAWPAGRWLDLAEARSHPAAVRAAVVANPPPGSLQGFGQLGLIQSLWAGVDRLLADATLPPHVPLARMVDPAMNAAMAETALWAVLGLHRGYFRYERLQREQRWSPHPQRRADELVVAVLGTGQMGRAVLQQLQPLGYRLRGWSAHAATGLPAGVLASHGEAALDALLAEADIIINLLPLTPRTEGLFDAARLARLRPQAALVNLARGAHVVEADLLAALDTGRLHHAVLDVFRTEPLPPGHPFWAHPRVTVLPHAAAQTDPRSAAQVVAANLEALASGAPLAHLVDRARGY